MIEEIRTSAYLKWENAGHPEGDGVPFWLAAEQEYWEASQDKLGKAVYWLVKNPHYKFGDEEFKDWSRMVAKFFINEFKAKMDEEEYTIQEIIEYMPWLNFDMRCLLFLRHKGLLTAKQVKDLFAECWHGVDPLDAIIKLDILNEAKADVVVALAKRLLTEKPQVLSDFKKGKKQALNSLIGPMMKELGGKADANKVRAVLEEQANAM